MATWTPLTVTVAGATGNLGQRIIKRLLAVPNVYVRGFARSPEKLPESISGHNQFTAIKGQVNDVSQVREAVEGSSVVLCAYQGYDDVMLHGQRILIDACEEFGVARYVSSDFTLDYNKLELGQHEGKDCMIQVKQYLQGKNVKGVHVLIGCFFETWLGYMHIWDPETRSFTFWGDGNELWEMTTFEDAARYAVEVVLDPTAVGTFCFGGDVKSTREIAQIYETVYGSKPTLSSRGSLSQLWDYMQAEKKKYEGQNKWNYMTWFYQYYILNGQTLWGRQFDNARYPQIKPDNIESFFKKNDVSDRTHRQMPL
ncbi:hypothetical protein BKA56DRAFT_558900 [Ilyonectria sp. MPI-CAGE-AT-0026]|nr:hypothetical protein BKA56DRAFT_558900 [Ilyonectria sp. MPI-CAGE-AT-0026]